MSQDLETTIELLAPDDWHVHLRDGSAMADAVQYTQQQFRRALIMPNLRPPVCDVAAALAYRQRICAALPADTAFEPKMAVYLTAATGPDDVVQVAAASEVLAFKLYPAGATTNAQHGVANLADCDEVFAEMEARGVVLCVHAESIDPDCDVFDREAEFLGRELAPLLTRRPGLRVVVEHLTTREGVEFVRSAGPNVAGTITPQHLLLNRNALFAGGLRPHNYCLPVLKREVHRQALVQAATCGEAKFFLGTDSAPHPQSAKESSCGCAGMFTAMTAMELYAEAFDAVGALDRLEGFASRHGALYYGLPINTARVRLHRRARRVPETVAFGDAPLVPYRGGEQVAWTFER